MKTNLIICITSLLLILGCETELEYCWTCGENLIDERDGQTYKTKLIGDQCWMIDNLKVGKALDNNHPIEKNSAIEYYCSEGCPSNENCEIGGLYTFDEANDYGRSGNKGICPKGWHMPSKDEFDVLTNYQIYTNDFALRFLEKFPAESTGITNPIGTAIHCEILQHVWEGPRIEFWSSTFIENGFYALQYYQHNGGKGHVVRVKERVPEHKGFGLCIRCIKDE